ncbi:MAG: sulfatase-like hydrolase/transferase, partial [Planctomycetota bacterium]
RRYRRQLDLGLITEDWKLTETDSRAYAWESADHDFEDHRMAVYAAMIDSMDQNIGRLLDALDNAGVADNTVVFFLSDNGGCAEEPGGRDPAERTPGPEDDYVSVGPAWGWAQNAPFRRYKTWMHEGGVCTPLIVRWPGRIEPGSITHQVGHVIDFMPTLLELAGDEHPRTLNGKPTLPVEGLSLVPVLEGRSRPPHERLCWHFNGNAAIRQGRWKLVWDKLLGAWELYDLESDRTEATDLAPSDPDRVSRMAADYRRWAKSVNTKQVDL